MSSFHLFLLAEGNILLFQLGGPLSFGAAKNISQSMSIVQDYRALILDLSEVPAIGVTATLAIEIIVLDVVNRDRQVWIVTTSAQVQRRIDKLQLQKFSEVHFTGDRFEALESISFTAMFDQTRHKMGRRAKPRNGFYILLCGGFESKLL
jgi:MFS superfamily sulfate permease-like transporter